jgi:hypothetical protein
MQTVTIFKKATDVNNPWYVSVGYIVERIRNGKDRSLTDLLRMQPDPEKRKDIKKKLPAICFSGTFSKREDAGLIKHSGLIAIDFDHLGDRLPELRKRLTDDPHTFILFLSPSGDGLKLVVRIPDSGATHRMSAAALTDYYNDEQLDEFKDVSRICFSSYDPDIYYNPDSKIFTTIKEETVVKKVIRTTIPLTDSHEILARIEERFAEDGKAYVDGNKHNYLVAMFGATNVFGIPLNEAISLVSFKYHNAASPVDMKDFEKVAVSVYNHYPHQFGSCTFNSKGEAIETITQKVVKITDLAMDMPLKDVIYLDAVRDDMLAVFHNGRSRGETTYFETIDERFRFKRGELTLMHGIMNQGKSTMMMQLCLIKSVKDGYKWAFFSPEQDPPSDFYDDLIHMYIGQSTLPYYHNQMSESEFVRGMDFIKEHFFFIYPEDDSPTPEYINTRFEALIYKHRVDGCIIDPYNQLDNDIRKTGGREDLYLSAFLSQQKRFAQKHHIFMFIVAHPKGTIKRNNNGDFEVPDVYDLAGGAMWANKCDNVLCTFRPYHRSAPGNGETIFYSHKIKKQRQCGTPGEVKLLFDPATMRYYESTMLSLKSNPLEEPVRRTIPADPDKFIESQVICPF